MKVLFFYSGSESVGISSLSAWLKERGHETALVFDPAHFRGSRGRDNPLLARFFDPPREEIVNTALSENPDILAFSCVTGNYRWALDLASEIKIRSAKPLPAIFGGVHPSMVPERVISRPEVDALVVGEAEEALFELVQSWDGAKFTNGDIANAWVKIDGDVKRNEVRPYLRDLDKLPFPDKELFYRKVPFLRRGYLLMTARGCPYNCAYCSNATYHKIYCGENGHVRRFSPGRVIEELKRGRRNGPINYINIYDDIFTLDLEWLEEFTPLYRREIGLPFLCNIHPNHCDEDRVRLIKEAGCHTVRLGVQTVHDATLKNSLHRAGSREKVGQAIDNLRKFHIHAKVEHIIGLPDEGPEIQEDAAAFYNEHRPTKVQAFWLIPFPGTRIHKTALERGIITPQESEDFEEGDPRLKFTFFLPNRISGRDNNALKPFPLLFDLLPLMPKSLGKKLIDSKLYRYLPFSPMLHQALILLSAIINFDREDIHALFYVFAKKNTP